MSWAEHGYAKQLAYRLKGFVQKTTSPFLANCCCPFCFDTSSTKLKRKFYFFEKAGRMMVFCQKCGYSRRFDTFLREFDINLYEKYALEMFKGKMAKEIKGDDHEKFIPQTTKYIPNIFESLPNINSLPEGHPAKLWCIKRCLPIDIMDFYLADKFIEWSKDNTDKFLTWRGPDHSRIVIPWRDRHNKIVGYSARCWDSEQEQKYYRIFVDDECKERFFGLDRIDDSKQKYVVEGEFDSLAIPNAVAVSNGKLHTFTDKDSVFIPDTDVRNRHIMRNVKEMIDLGLKVCLLPPEIGKDLNELRQQCLTSAEIANIINTHTYQGLEAKLKFTQWSKV